MATDVIARGLAATALNTASSIVSGFSPIKQVLNAVRAITTFPRDQIVWTTDTQLWYRGDGHTVGGVLSATGVAFTAAELSYLRININRNKFATNQIEKVRLSGQTADIPTAWVFGNSIPAGGNASSSAAAFPGVLATAMAAYTGVGARTDWQGYQLASAGSLIPEVMVNLGDSAEGASGGGTNYYPNRLGVFANTNPGWALIFALKNQENLGTYTNPQTSWMLRISCQQLKRHNFDAVMMIDLPNQQISGGVGTGYLDPFEFDTAHVQARQSAANAAAAENISLCDTWTYFYYLTLLGMDYSIFFAAGEPIHPNDLGHLQIGNLLFALMTNNTGSYASGFERPKDSVYNCGLQLYSVWKGANLAGGGVTQAWNVAPLSTPTAVSTARAFQLSEGTPQVIVLPSGGSAIHNAPAPFSSFILYVYQALTSTGTFTVTYRGQTWSNISSTRATYELPQGKWFAVPFGVSGFNYIGSNYPNPSGSGNINTVTVTAVGGQVSYMGIQFITPYIVETHAKWANSVEVGTWSDQTVAQAGINYSETGRGSSTVGDTLTITWYGTDLTCYSGFQNSLGKFTIATDGGGSVTVDSYTASFSTAHLQTIQLAYNLTEGWHTTVITVATKNASSSGNLVTFSRFQSLLRRPDPSSLSICLGSGETMNLPEYWSGAVIQRTISGTPVVNFTSGASSITCTGGAAVVRLTRGGI